jgi:hypothetical protein
MPDISVAEEGVSGGCGTWNIMIHPKGWLCIACDVPDVGVLISQLIERLDAAEVAKLWGLVNRRGL